MKDTKLTIPEIIDFIKKLDKYTNYPSPLDY